MKALVVALILGGLMLVLTPALSRRWRGQRGRSSDGAAAGGGIWHADGDTGDFRDAADDGGDGGGGDGGGGDGGGE